MRLWRLTCVILSVSVFEAFRIWRAEANKEVKSTVIFGEYFGGWYPHEGVNGQGVGVGQPVFKDTVAYSPCHHFYAFDVWVDGSYLDYDVAIDLLERAGFPFVAEPIASAASLGASPIAICCRRDFLNGFRKSRVQNDHVVRSSV